MESPDAGLLKQQMRAVWTAGDFGKVAERSAAGAAEFVDRLQIRPGSAVLDVACGTGNLAIPAARAGAIVTGVDIAPNLLEQARERAAADGVTVAFDEGDAEALPYAAERFDLVMTMFGAMFAPQPERVAVELVRVCRSGGTIAMANWVRDGFVGQTFALGARYVPPPPGLPSPLQWGDERMVRERLGSGTTSMQLTRRTVMLDFPFKPVEVVQFFRQYFGPTQLTFARLDPAGQAAYGRDLAALWSERNEGSGERTVVAADYLEVIAVRR